MLWLHERPVKASSVSGTSCLSAPELAPICSAVTSRNTCALVHYVFLDTSGCGSGLRVPSLDDSPCRFRPALAYLLTAPASAFTVCIDVSSRPVNYGNNSSLFAHPLCMDCKPSRLQLIYLPDRLKYIVLYMFYIVSLLLLCCVLGYFLLSSSMKSEISCIQKNTDIFVHTPPLTACGVEFADA